MESTLSHNQQLRKKISDLEESLSTLKQQLKEQEEEAQHDAIENLETYLSQVDNKYENLRSLWSIIKDEIQEMFNKNQSNKSEKGEPS